MLTLGIEISGRNSSVALLKGKTVLEQVFLSEGTRPETRRLPVCVQEILAQHCIKPNELDCLAVSRGPGSFTGLRVGIVFAKMFGYTTKVDLVAVDTFAATVEKIALEKQVSQDEIIEVVEDLRKGQIAWQRFSFQNEHWQAESEIAVDLIEDWVKFSRENVFITGGGIDRILKQLPVGDSLDANTIMPVQYRFPDAVAVANTGQKKLVQGEPIDPFELKPLYIRRSAAEEKAG